MTDTLKPWLILLAVVAIFAVGFLAGHSLATNAKNAEISGLRADQARANEEAAREGARRLQDAMDRGDALTRRLAAAEADRNIQKQENEREIKRLTTGRACLGAGAVRLLNQPATGLRLGALPPPTGEPAATDAAFATDTDVALWAGNARREYESCRDRVTAIAEFFDGENREEKK